MYIWRMLSVSTSEVLKHDKAPRKRSSGVPCRRGRVAVSRGRKCGTRVPLAPYALHKYTYIASHARARRVCGPLSRDTGIARVARCGHGHAIPSTLCLSRSLTQRDTDALTSSELLVGSLHDYLRRCLRVFGGPSSGSACRALSPPSGGAVSSSRVRVRVGVGVGGGGSGSGERARRRHRGPAAPWPPRRPPCSPPHTWLGVGGRG